MPKAGKPIVLVQFPSAGLVLGDTAIKNPGCKVDTLLETTEAVDGKLVLSSVVLVRGLGEPAFRDLVRDLETQYGASFVEVIAESAPDLQWSLRTHMAMDRIQSPTLRFLIRFQKDYAFPWGHIEGAKYEMRGEAQSEASADELVQRVRAFFHAARLDAKIAITTLSDADVKARAQLMKLAQPPSEK